MPIAATPQSPPKSTAPSACDHHAFPMFRHKGQWCEKIAYKHRYFGAVANDLGGEKAWERYKRELPFWKAGMNPREMAKQQNRRLKSVTRSRRSPASGWSPESSLIESDDPDTQIGHRTFDESSYAVRRCPWPCAARSAP